MLCAELDPPFVPGTVLIAPLADPDYDGPREAKDIIAAATTSMPTFVKRAATPAEVEALREKVHSERLLHDHQVAKCSWKIRATWTDLPPPRADSLNPSTGQIQAGLAPLHFGLESHPAVQSPLDRLLPPDGLFRSEGQQSRSRDDARVRSRQGSRAGGPSWRRGGEIRRCVLSLSRGTDLLWSNVHRR